MAMGTMAATQLVAIWIMGGSVILDYYLRVGPSVMAYYRAHVANISLLSLGWRLFYGTGSLVLLGQKSPPLVYAPRVAWAVGYILPLGMAVLGIWMAARRRRFDSAFGLLMYVSLLISPILWTHYVILAALPLVVTARELYSLGFPKKETIAIGLAVLVLSLPTLTFLGAAAGGEDLEVPFAVALGSLIPLFSLLGCFYLSYRLSVLCEIAGGGEGPIPC
jgi:hypothetical protein